MIKAQAIEGIPYMKRKLPKGMEPEELFNYLKERITYKHDPPGIELVHTPQSFFEDNYHGEPGAGDCDDFSTIGISALKAQGIPESKICIILTGRTRVTPKHIYLSVNDQIFDLTNDQIGEERKYPYKQVIPLPLL